MSEDEDTVFVGLRVRIGDMVVSIDQALPGQEFRRAPVVSLEERVHRMIVQLVPSAVGTFDARARRLLGA